MYLLYTNYTIYTMYTMYTISSVQCSLATLPDPFECPWAVSLHTAHNTLHRTNCTM